VQGYLSRRPGDGTWHCINRGQAGTQGGRAQAGAVGRNHRQSVKTTESGGPRGFDMAKKVKGRKRPIVPDTEGAPLALPVHAARVQDNPGAGPLRRSPGSRFPKLRHIFADRD